MSEQSFDALILGCGPAGMAAAARAAALGLRVGVLDDQAAPGGQVWRGIERAVTQGRASRLGQDYVDGLSRVSAFRASGAEYFPDTAVWQIEPGYRVFTQRGGSVRILGARSILIATGAMERPVPFPGWTLPGVLTVGAAQILLKTADQVPEEPVWLAGSGPLLLLYATQLLDAGGRIAGILDTQVPGSRRRALGLAARSMAGWRDVLKGAQWATRLKSVTKIPRVVALEAFGTDTLEAIGYRTANGAAGRVPAKVLLVHEGLLPDTCITRALGCRHHWIDAQQCYAPVVDEWGETSVPHCFVAGDAAGIAGAEAARIAGEIAGYALARAAGLAAFERAKADMPALRTRLVAAMSLRPLLDALYAPRSPLAALTDETIVCRCESVTAGELRSAIAEGAGEPNHLKAQTRCGMGACLGRQCGTLASMLVAEATGETMERTDLARARPPLRPITLAQLAALARTQS